MVDVLTGGTRAQRRNQKRKREASNASTSQDASTVTKKTKKEKKREIRAAAAADEEKQARELCNSTAAAPEAEHVSKGLRVFVGHLPQSTTEQALRDRFNECGKILDVVMLRRHDGAKRFKGQAFLSFERSAQAKRALALDGSEWPIGGSAEQPKRIVVAAAQAAGAGRRGAAEHGRASSREDSRGPSAGPPDAQLGASSKTPSGATSAPSSSSSCFVGNLPAEATEKEVRSVFRSKCGPATIRKVHLLPSVGETRRGFVDFRTADAALTATGARR